MLFYGQLMQQHHGLDPAGNVEESRRLVQQDDRALLRQGFGDHGLLPFTVAQFGYVVLCFMGNAGCRQRLFDNLPIGFLQLSEETGVRMTAQRHQFVNGDAARIRLFRQYNTYRQ